VQIQKYKNVENNPHDRNPYNHTPQDSLAFVNRDYFLAQIKAAAAAAAVLAVPVSGP